MGELANTSLQHTIADMERLREHLGIDRWIVSGPSWGSTVAIAYGEAHPERCIGIKATGVWLCRRADTDGGTRACAGSSPTPGRSCASLVEVERRDDLRHAYHELLNGDDLELAQRAGQALYEYEESFMHLEPPFMGPRHGARTGVSRVLSPLRRQRLLPHENQLVEDAHRLRGIPVSLLTGRYDNCTTPDGAWNLAQELDDVHLELVNASGHYPTESAMSRAMALETTRFLDDLARARGLL